jgi:hypothetical protein
MGTVRKLVARARRRVVADVLADRYLRYLLVLAALLCGFWFWHRVPNFATKDEVSRLLDVLVAVGSVLSDPSWQGLQDGVTWGRTPFGATFYLFLLAVLPVLAVLVLRGELAVLEAFVAPSREFGYYTLWTGTPEWVWTFSIGAIRLVNVALAVGCVYLTYRLGTAVADRTVGRLAGLLLTLSFGFLTIAHEAGEDMPALFLVLVALYLLVRYVRTGEAALFLAASALGGLALAFKLTAAPVVVLVAVAHLLRRRQVVDGWRGLLHPRLVAGGAALGAVALVVGMPTALVAGPEPFLGRVFGDSAARVNHATGPDAPVWWWFLRGYLSGLGLPLVVAAAGGLAATLAHLRRRPEGVEGTVLVLVGLGSYLLVFAGWHDFRVHHLLPTFPLLMITLAGSLVRLQRNRRRAGRALIALLVVTSGVYAVTGDLQYASMPRDQAADWLRADADAGDTVEVYRWHLQDTAVPHGMDVNHVRGPEEADERLDPCPEYVMLGYRDLLYLDNDTYARNRPDRADYVRSLLDGEYAYEIVAEFGPRPPGYVPQRPEPGSVVDLLHLGVIPHTDQYADEQELAENQYTVILRRTGECSPDRRPPF